MDLSEQLKQLVWTVHPNNVSENQPSMKKKKEKEQKEEATVSMGLQSSMFHRTSLQCQTRSSTKGDGEKKRSPRRKSTDTEGRRMGTSPSRTPNKSPRVKFEQEKCDTDKSCVFRRPTEGTFHRKKSEAKGASPVLSFRRAQESRREKDKEIIRLHRNDASL